MEQDMQAGRLLTRLSPNSSATLPEHLAPIDLSALDGPDWKRLATVHDAATLARAAAVVPVDPPASPDMVRECMLMLRVSTSSPNASDAEQIAAANALMLVMSDVPARLLERACRIHVERSAWFPRPAEMMAAVAAAREELGESPSWQRHRRLQWLAERAAADQRRREIEAAPVDPAEVEALARRIGGACHRRPGMV